MKSTVRSPFPTRGSAPARSGAAVVRIVRASRRGACRKRLPGPQGFGEPTVRTAIILLRAHAPRLDPAVATIGAPLLRTADRGFPSLFVPRRRVAYTLHGAAGRRGSLPRASGRRGDGLALSVAGSAAGRAVAPARDRGRRPPHHHRLASHGPERRPGCFSGGAGAVRARAGGCPRPGDRWTAGPLAAPGVRVPQPYGVLRRRLSGGEALADHAN